MTSSMVSIVSLRMLSDQHVEIVVVADRIVRDVDAAEMIGDAARPHGVELRLHGGVGRRRDDAEFPAESKGVCHEMLLQGLFRRMLCGMIRCRRQRYQQGDVPPCCEPGRSISNRCATAASSMSAASGSTTSPPIRRSATPPRTVAAIYDMKADPANRDTMTYEEDGGRHSIYFLRPKTRDDLQRRMDGAPQDRRPDLRHVRPLARPRRVVRHRHGDEAGRAAGAARLRRQPARTTIATSATTTPTWSTRWCRRRPRAIRNSIRSRTSRCRRCASCARTTTAS